MTPERNFFRYLPRQPDVEALGVRVLDAGCTKVPPGSPYPMPGHPEGHHFSWETGRCLDAYTFVYITAGGGIFDSEASGEVVVRPGDLFIVFPGVWHRYRPLCETGWDEYWVECEGPGIEAAVGRAGLSSARPVRTVGHDDGFLRCFLSVMETIKAEPPGFEEIIGLRSLEIVARIHSLLTIAAEGVSTSDKLVKKAISRMREDLCGAIDWEELARSLGASYSSFRRLFRKQTGHSPGNYFIGMKITRAGQLLASPERSIQDVSDQLGFESVYYFSRLFKSRTGVPPSSFRKISLQSGQAAEKLSERTTI